MDGLVCDREGFCKQVNCSGRLSRKGTACRSRSPNSSNKGINGNSAGHPPSGMAAHAIGHDPQTEIIVDRKGILIRLPSQTCVREAGSLPREWSPTIHLQSTVPGEIELERYSQWDRNVDLCTVKKQESRVPCSVSAEKRYLQSSV